MAGVERVLDASRQLQHVVTELRPQVTGLEHADAVLPGDGAAVVAGVVIAVVCVIGIVLTLRPATGADLLD